ncbi:UDP-2,4-diacetamido-2,4,6-trideoxy-beta-L-altropyranose hydrolase [Pusillimonas sp. MFBS29]|uniref:UDP-2,4-diacetamido-2,4, 6-trideoxy-beta-L-altropyranose hydrolase n=1 Tax=Pusillimonas sp. MFBS29 TaxID=2886690 RepID=UPI001D116351|nr:UDP-2,4-diacetamido-2,4,6-trideoxy-beta-L-altropyranose hydrolase [Pusillimonas sp. MFBS29]MCC2597547.1 UDP-2,4-diacetamido-2,4,6-trideoxy-beta-L-altropyranose hydrolase [Pusillimonas sp. MFBS29]
MNSRTVAFRVDASVDIGTGHLMRCLTLANALRFKGYQAHFICREHPGHLIHLVQQSSYQIHVLPYANDSEVDDLLIHSHWLGTTQSQDAALCIQILSNIRPQWLIVDHYALDMRWEQALKQYCKKILVIDDLADRIHQCNILLDQTLGRRSEDYWHLVPKECKVLNGAKYALLRPEFKSLRSYSLQRRDGTLLQSILVSMGGVDKNNATGQILEALKTIKWPLDSTITVIMGGTAPWLQFVREQAESMPIATKVLVDVSDMAKQMANSDLAIGAAGATSWERCCLGLPTIMIVLADNQLKIAEGLLSVNAVSLVENTQNISYVLPILIREIQRNPAQLARMSLASANVIDGAGVSRVIRYLVE